MLDPHFLFAFGSESSRSIARPATSGLLKKALKIGAKNQYAPPNKIINNKGANPAKGAQTNINSSPKIVALYQKSFMLISITTQQIN